MKPKNNKTGEEEERIIIIALPGDIRPLPGDVLALTGDVAALPGDVLALTGDVAALPGDILYQSRI